MDEHSPPPVRYVRDDTTLWRGVIGGVLLMPPGARESWHVTSPGDLVWDDLAVPRTIEQLVERLSGRFDEPPATIRADIEPVVRTMLEIGALRTC